MQPEYLQNCLLDRFFLRSELLLLANKRQPLRRVCPMLMLFDREVHPAVLARPFHSDRKQQAAWDVDRFQSSVRWVSEFQLASGQVRQNQVEAEFSHQY